LLEGQADGFSRGSLTRPTLSPNLAQLNRDAFVVDEAETTVGFDKHRGDSDLGDLDLGAED
jgi:hypothetical protein